METINLIQLRKETGIDEVLEQLNQELIGLEPVKKRVKDIASLLVVEKARRLLGLKSTPPSLHMCFSGNPGTGKTTVAMKMASILHRLEYIRRDNLVAVTRDDLVGQYIGHTAPKTKEVVKKAMGGVLFIDEAYYLYRPENEKDYGQESIEILLQIMENQREDLVVILAGYKDKMDIFFKSNPGLASRVANHIDFPDYSVEELQNIACLMGKDMNYEFSSEFHKVLKEYIIKRMSKPHFANARSIRNAIDRARMRQASRLFNDSAQSLTAKELVTLEPEDILVSRIFTQESNLKQSEN